MSSILSSPRLPFRVTACGVALALFSGCWTPWTPPAKYKRASGKFPEWQSYEGKHFYPANGTVIATDLTANTVTFGKGEKDAKTFVVTPATRIVHEGTDITLAQLAPNQEVKYLVAADGKQLLSIWFGTRLYRYHPPGGARQ